MENNLDKTGRVAKNTFFLFLRMLLVLGVGLYTSRIVLDILGVEDFGIYNVVGAIVVLFSFLQNALTNATYRFITFDLGTGNIENLRKTFSMALNIHIILAIGLLFLCETIGLYILNTNLNIAEDRMFAANIAYQFSVLCFCTNIIKTPYNSSIIAHEKMSFFAWTSIIEALGKLLVVFLLPIIAIDKLVLYAFLILAITIILLLCYYLYCRKNFNECRYQKYWDKDIFRKMLKYSCWSMLVNGADVCVNQSAVFFFNIFFGVVSNAALGLANQVNAHLNNFLNSFTQAYNPQIIKSYASKDFDYFYKLLFSTSKISFYLLFLITIPLLINIDFILGLWLKEVPKDTSVFVIVIAIYSLIDAYSAPLWIGVHATGNLKGHQILMSAIKILNIPIAYILLRLGYAAWTVLALKAFLNFICSIARPCYVKKLYGLPLKDYFTKMFLPVSIVTICTIPIPLIISPNWTNGWEKFCITSALFELIAFLTIWFIGMNIKERNLLKKIIASRRKS